MATTYDIGTFDVGVLPGGLHKDARSLCHGAVALGWKVVVKQMMVRLVSPDGQHTITLSASNSNIPYERHKKTIHKHGNPLLVPKDDNAAYALADNLILAEQESARRRLEREAAEKQRIEQAKADRAEEKRLSRERQEQVSAQKLPSTEKVIEPGGGLIEPRPHIISEFPMMAHRGQGKGYPSPTTNERKWSDGTIDYTCRSEGCDFAAEKRMGVGAHWRTHVNRGEEEPAPKPLETYSTPPHEPAYSHGYTPRRERVVALTEVLAALDLTAMSAEELAEFVLNWQHQQSESGSRLAAEREEMTSDDVLNRIRSLLDNGTYLRQQEEIETLRSDRDLVHLALEQAQGEAREAKEKWDTLRSLMEDA